MILPGQHSLIAKALSLTVAAFIFAGWANGQTPQSDCAKQSAAAHYTPIKSIDFSSKHNIMIKSSGRHPHADGRALLPVEADRPWDVAD